MVGQHAEYEYQQDFHTDYKGHGGAKEILQRSFFFLRYAGHALGMQDLIHRALLGRLFFRRDVGFFGHVFSSFVV